MLFNKSTNGATELKGLIGFIYKSINFDNLKSYIAFSEADIKKLIGDELYVFAEDHYTSAKYELATPDPLHPEYELYDELVHKMQMVIALHAYRMYVPSNDITHSDKGRQIRVNEEEKPAFEWQIEKDNENLLLLAYRAEDALLDFLFAQIPEAGPENEICVLWVTAPQYIAIAGLFVRSAEEFDTIFPINKSRRTYLVLAPFMKRVQEGKIKACFLDAKYDEIVEELLDNDLTADNAILVEMGSVPLALYTISLAMRRLSAQLLPEGIFQTGTAGMIGGRTPAGKPDREEIAGRLEKDADAGIRKLQEYIRKITLESEGETFTTIDPTERMDSENKFFRF